jgi:predicted patatin/cPLA2 family phospholipase
MGVFATARFWLGVVSCFTLASGSGCFHLAQRMIQTPSPVQAGIAPADIADRSAESDSCELFDAATLYRVAEQIRQERRPTNPPPKRSVLVLSGGGAYGAFSAGVLVGWSASGNRPKFDTVTGISTGALIAPFAFLGSEYDGQLRQFYTQVQSSDIFRIKKSVRTLFADSIADNSGLIEQVEKSATPAILAAIAAEHAKGRRLYVGTTELDGRRQVVWDLGAIASRGTPQDLALFRSVILASAAIPGFFPPVRIPVDIDGQVYEERHVDGGVTASLFFRPPWIAPQYRSDPSFSSLHDTDLYIIVAGKLYPDPDVVRPRALAIAGTGVSTLLYSGCRGDLMRLYTACILTGMNYHLAAIPADVPVNIGSTDFDPVKMGELFNYGQCVMTGGTAWRATPPGLEKGEGVSIRGGSSLTRIDNTPINTKPTPQTQLFPRLNPVREKAVPILPGSIEK